MGAGRAPFALRYRCSGIWRALLTVPLIAQHLSGSAAHHQGQPEEVSVLGGFSRQRALLRSILAGACHEAEHDAMARQGPAPPKALQVRRADELAPLRVSLAVAALQAQAQA